MKSMEASKFSDFGLYPNGSAIALWCNGNTPDSCQGMQEKGPVDLLVADSGIAGSNPVRAALGHSYNGYYSRLLICQIRVRIPDGPLIWLHSLAGQDAVLAYRLGRCSCFAGCATGTPQPFKSEIWVQAPLELLYRPID